MASIRKREHGEGTILARGPDTWRLRYRVNGKRYSVTFKGSRANAKTKLRELLRSGDTGQHVAPDRLSVKDWVGHWIETGAPGSSQKRAGRRTVERYSQLLRVHVVPKLGAKRLQALKPTDIDDLYNGFDCKIAPRTAHHVHTVLRACLGSAVRKGLMVANPIDRAEKIPSPGESDRGQVLDEQQLGELVKGFRNSTLYPIVVVAAFTGARRNEILALRWCDLDAGNKTIRIARAMEETKEGGRTIKAPKTERGKRTVAIDDGLLALLLAERAKHARYIAGITDDDRVDLSLVRLPEGALMFPSFAGGRST